ncbi:hypothetical protein C8R45DRAFT_1013284 [Mycena sanguinolenta]|nr:hypothetical protein C8R45DRAFT_1013284 [Mycena sanguinolenta]
MQILGPGGAAPCLDILGKPLCPDEPTFLLLAVGLVSAAPIAEDVVAARDVFNDCFNLGYEDGESSGCNSASGNNGARALSERQLQCTGNFAKSFNEGFNAGFNDGFNRCF